MTTKLNFLIPVVVFFSQCSAGVVIFEKFSNFHQVTSLIHVKHLTDSTSHAFVTRG